MDLHACQDPDCEYAHGYEEQIETPGQRVSRAAAVLDVQVPKLPRWSDTPLNPPGQHNAIITKVQLLNSAGAVVCESEVDAMDIASGGSASFTFDLTFG